MLLHNPNLNWFMNATSSYEMSHVNCLNSNAYITLGVWQSDRNLFIDVCSLSKYLKLARNYLINVAKLFKSGD
jgi:hypothetical protein